MPQKDLPIAAPETADQQAITHIGWFGANHPATTHTERIRAINMHLTLKQLGFHSEMDDDPDRLEEWDTIVFYKASNAFEYEQMQRAKAMGKRVVLDVAVDRFDEQEALPYYLPMLELATIVIAASHALADKIRPYQAKVWVVEDTVEVLVNEGKYHATKKLKAAWMGSKAHLPYAEGLRSLLRSCGYELVCQSFDSVDDPKAWYEPIATCDIGIVPLDIKQASCLSNFALSTLMAMGLPVIASPVDAHHRVITDGQNGYLPFHPDQWRDALLAMKDVDVRKRIGMVGRNAALRFRPKNIALKLARLLAPEDFDRHATDLIIPTIYNPDHLRITVESIIACTQVPYHIWVINNGQHELELPEEVTVIKTDGLNYAASLNLGVQKSKAPYIGMLNDDIILTDGWLEPLLETIKQGAGLANPMSTCCNGSLYNEPLEIDGVSLGPDQNDLRGLEVCQREDPQKKFFYEMVYNYQPPCARRVFEMSWVALYCTISSREAMEAVGLLDEQFGHGHEDVDYSIRMKKLGWPNRMNENGFIFHFGGTSSNKLRLEKPDVYSIAKTHYHSKYDKPLWVVYADFPIAPGNHSPEKMAEKEEDASATIKMAEALVQRGYRVIVFGDCETGKRNEVAYHPLNEFEAFNTIHAIDMLIYSKAKPALPYPVRAVKEMVWTPGVDVEGFML